MGWAPAEADVYPCFSQRGKTVPEELVKPEELSKYRQVASHVVSAGMGKLPHGAGNLLWIHFWESFAVCGIDLGLSSLAQGLHSASIPGILALDLCPSDTNKILTGKGALLAVSHLGMGLFP